MTLLNHIQSFIHREGRLPSRAELARLGGATEHTARAALDAYRADHPDTPRHPQARERGQGASVGQVAGQDAPHEKPSKGPARYMPSQASSAIPYNGEDGVWVVFSDIHFPFQDERIVDKLLWFLRMVKPDGLLANGDLLDFYELSRFSKDPRRKKDTSLNNELKQCREFLRSAAQASGARWKIFHLGNHEARLESRLSDKLPELSGLESPDGGELMLTVEYLLGLPDLGWTAKPYRAYTTLGDMDIEHGSNVSKPAAMPSGQTIRNVLIRRQRSTGMGHIHTQAHVINSSRGGSYLHGLELGCLCDLIPEYDPDARWQHGWGVVTVRAGVAYPELVQVRGGQVFWRGEVL